MVNLDDTTPCPLADQCHICGSQTNLRVATYGTQLGVFCATMCETCADPETTQQLALSHVMYLVMDHCQHLGIDLDQMAAVIEAEQSE